MTVPPQARSTDAAVLRRNILVRRTSAAPLHFSYSSRRNRYSISTFHAYADALGRSMLRPYNGLNVRQSVRDP